MLHTIGFEQLANPASLTAITPIPDPSLRVTGNDFLVPAKMNNIAWVAASVNNSLATLRAQLQSPSLRRTFQPDIAPIANGLVFGSLPPYVPLWENPLPLDESEPLDFLIQNGAATTVVNRGLVTLTDGPAKPVTGKIFSIRFTTSIALATASWVNGALTLASTLPFGNYDVVGMRVWSANLVAARLVFVGYPWRPGVLGQNAEANVDWPAFRFGNKGVYGSFLSLVPPTLDALGVTDTAQSGYLDLIKTS